MRVACLVLPWLAVLACGGNVVFDEAQGTDEPLPVADDGRFDPELTCAEILRRLDVLDCKGDQLGDVSCERRLNNANERGCVDETRAYYECSTRACDSCYMEASLECVWECDQFAEAMIACFGGETGPGGGSPE